MSTPTQRGFWLRHRFRFVLGYVALLVLSWLRVAQHPHPPPPPTVDLSRAARPWVMLLEDPLHGSAECLDGLKERPLLRPALPGLNVPAPAGNTFESLAQRLIQSLPEEPVVVVANGHAGAVALHLAAARPDRIRALLLLDASGVQEFSLLGEYHLNYSLYAVSDLALRLFDWGVPHFGLWRELALKRSQIGLLRNSDRRKLRPLFDEIQSPALIVRYHDSQMAVSAANEHRRLLPQSESRHLVQASQFPAVLDAYLEELREARAPARPQAPDERIAEAERAFNPSDRPRPTGWALFGVLAALAIATIFTEDLTCAITGLMIANGNLSWAQGIGACLGGILFYDYLIYLAGRRWGRPALGRIPLRWMIDPADLRETEEWFGRRTGGALLITRFIPGTRGPAFLAAGILGVPYKTFTFWFVLANVIWTPLFIGVSALLAEKALVWIDRYSHTAPALVVAGILLFLLITHVLLPACYWRGRRRLYGRWKRITRPEFWPAWTLYLPVLLRQLFRSLRKGNHLLDFTACNPAFPASGFVGESKSAILDLIGDRGAVAPYRFLPASLSREDRVAACLAFADTLPVVLKPDAGERGFQVMILRDAERLRAAAADLQGDWIIQKYIPGVEYGVFYMRDPDAPSGFIFAVTRKTFPLLVGDGRRNIEDLILAHDRAVCQYRMHLQQLRDRLYDIPGPGEVVPLTEIGNHARGALFEEGAHLITPELTARIDAISRSLPGFYFGSYDIRCPDENDFRAGRNLTVIELNGVTSEATSLYDPRKRYTEMVLTLLIQWDWAARIGRKNRERGAPLTPLRSLLADFDAHHRRVTAARIQALERNRA